MILAFVRDVRKAQRAHLRRDHFDERRAALDGVDVLDGGPHRLIRQVALIGRNFLLFDAHFFQSADGNQRLLHSVLHAFHQR